MHVVIIDNYDSFVYNLARYVNELGVDCDVIRNNDMSVVEIIAKYKPSHCILSPGPCTPNEAGICLELVGQLAGEIPILGVCLGHQVIAQAFGGKIIRAEYPLHGIAALATHDQRGIFKDLANPADVARYHSLVVDSVTLPACFTITATSFENEIMAIQHKKLPLFGVQFHPESVLTKNGIAIIKRFLEY